MSTEEECRLVEAVQPLPTEPRLEFHFPWGLLGLEDVLKSGRALAYLRWLFRQENPTTQLDPLLYLNRLVGLRTYRTAKSFGRVGYQCSNQGSNPHKPPPLKKKCGAVYRKEYRTCQ